MPKPTEAYLLDVVEVDKARRVRCQAEGCGHAVYARIHVMLVDGKFLVLGGDCFQRLFGKVLPEAKSYYGGSANAPTVLTEEMRALLNSNTAEFIERLERRRLQIEEELAQREAVQQAKQHESTMPMTSGDRSASTLGLSSAMPEARERLRRQFPGVDLSSAGWSGLVLQEARAVLRERIARNSQMSDTE
jgi:hypothetical protein